MNKDNVINQISKAAVVLKEMRENISSDDRTKCAAELSITSTTISIYLNGKGTDLSTAEKLIVFFRKMITKREQLLTGE